VDKGLIRALVMMMIRCCHEMFKGWNPQSFINKIWFLSYCTV